MSFNAFYCSIMLLYYRAIKTALRGKYGRIRAYFNILNYLPKQKKQQIRKSDPSGHIKTDGKYPKIWVIPSVFVLHGFFRLFSKLGKSQKSRKLQSRESRRVAENRKRVEKSALFFIKLFTPQSR